MYIWAETRQAWLLAETVKILETVAALSDHQYSRHTAIDRSASRKPLESERERE